MSGNPDSESVMMQMLSVVDNLKEEAMASKGK